MIVDTSALFAVLTGEPEGERLLEAMMGADTLSVAAPTVVEASIVLHARQGAEAVHDLQAFLYELEFEVVSFDERLAKGAVEAWERFGKSRHAAKLNLGDLFSYALAWERGEELLFKGDDFVRTDVLVAKW